VSQSRVFKPAELGIALLFAVLLEAVIIVALAVAGGSKSLATDPAEEKMLIPIQVTPVIDDLPMLKLGSKAKAKLPDMWRKPPPKPKYEEKSAPSPLAEKNPTELPKSPVAKASETPPPPSADLAQQVDQPPPEESVKPEETTLPEEGDNAGVKEGTEVDPLKAFVVDQYKMKLISWFKAGFSNPALDCATLAGLITRVAAQVSADGTVTSYTVAQGSGNEVFDARVKAHMDRKVGQQVPPPPPKYPDIRESVMLPTFSGKSPKCKDSSPSNPTPEPAPEDPPTAPEAPEEL
jgi:TonB C terminal